MGKVSGIDYVDASWGPWRGCTKVSPGCQHCYAERSMNWYGLDFNSVTRAANRTFEAPLRWEEPMRIMVCPWGDFFHPAADDWRGEALDVVARCPHHTFIVVTKRPERIIPCLYETGYLVGGDSLRNVWFLTTAENQEMADRRIPELLNLRQHGNWPVLGVSIEPMLGAVELAPRLDRLDWVIVGAESGPNHRTCNLDWVRRIRDDCKAAAAPLFVKQIRVAGQLVKDADQFPIDFRIRQIPTGDRQ